MRGLWNDAYAILFLILFVKTCYLCSSELPEAIQMSTNNMFLLQRNR